MKCSRFVYSAHSLQAIINRNIAVEEVEETINSGEVITSYETDKPYPSKLVLNFISAKPIRVVAAQNPDTLECIVITAYVPDPLLWDREFKQKIK